LLDIRDARLGKIGEIGQVQNPVLVQLPDIVEEAFVDRGYLHMLGAAEHDGGEDLLLEVEAVIDYPRLVVTIEEVPGILGDSPVTVRRYYAKWTPEYQSRQDTLIRKIHGTNLAQAEEQMTKQ
jgi:hypothetical protein